MAIKQKSMWVTMKFQHTYLWARDLAFYTISSVAQSGAARTIVAEVGCPAPHALALGRYSSVDENLFSYVLVFGTCNTIMDKMEVFNTEP